MKKIDQPRNDTMILINRCFVVDLNKSLVKDLHTNHVSSIGLNETELLNYFLAHPNELLSKQQIIDNIWTKRGVVVEESSLMNALSCCRKAFGDKSGDVIKTERGKGYRFVAVVDAYSTEQTLKEETEQKDESDIKPEPLREENTEKTISNSKYFDVSSLFSGQWIMKYAFSGILCFLLGYYGSAAAKAYRGPKNAEDYSYRIYDSCVYKTKKGDVKIDLGSAHVISTGGLSIAINDNLESVSFPSEIVGRFCE
ncbi:winged helix-turn-helix domain-containing protein [Vibrio crassostreae]|uniref:winged helix-turn-helix domain-containing protein n=1 Tax=Vibrio crassostreae TaxID=246167 RepID=UPI0003749E48|nr:winged helix-turn-helix domain-containing protein [Vibrio crassostreae]